MYTQCPDCGLAFRVTADVLKVAAGKVRCGGCASAFNALDYLSEEMPEQREAAPDAEPQLPELKPEPLKADDSLPESISAEQSAALLKTLDQLAGSDIRIEDTGVEWMVLDEEDEEAQVDEVLEDSPTPVDEFLTNTPEVVDSPEIFEESANAPAQTPVEELRFDDNTPLPEDFGFEETASTRPSQSEPEPEPEPEPEAPQPDIALSDPHEWTDILDEFEELAEEVAAPLDEELDALLDDEADEEEDVVEEEIVEAADEDALDDELPAVEELVDEEPVDEETSVDDLEFEVDDESEEIAEEELLDEDEEQNEEEEEDDEPEELVALGDDEELDVVDEDPQLDLIDEPEVEEHDIEAELAMADDEDDDEVEDQGIEAADEDEDDDHYIPPMSEEEQTVNMQIDQELFAIAVEDEDGFASTIVIPEDWSEEKALESKGDDGAEVKSALDDEKRAADVAEAAELQAIAKAAEAEAARKSGTSRYGMIAGVVLLVILLIVQVVHHSREALATYPAFNNTVGPIYRALGKPLQPAWDVTGWTIEATDGRIGGTPEDETEEVSQDLKVYSRIGNESETALPYPLVRISLSDRFLEPLGSHVLNPGDYLGNNMDPRKLVEPGDSFEALITVVSPPLEASSYEVDVCYRQAEGLLRCKDENFK